MIYLDNASTTLPNEKILSEYKDNSLLYFANSSSNHKLGLMSNIKLEESRKSILKTLNLNNHNVVFTSGATESINLALKGIVKNYKNRGKHIISVANEHLATLNALESLKKEGFEITLLHTDKEGKVSVKELEESIRKDTIIVSIMHVNNETGAINDIKKIAEICKKYPKVFLHVDATQAIGKLLFNYNDVDLISFSGHKIHAPKNSGALIYLKKITFDPILSGGGHEFNFRSGTVDVAKAIALASALKEEYAHIKDNLNHVKELNNYLREELNNRDDIIINSSVDASPYIFNFSFKNKKASVVVEALSNKDIFISSVSACSSKKNPYSYVVFDMNNDMNLASNTLRVSFSKDNTIEEVKTFISEFDNIVRGIHENR